MKERFLVCELHICTFNNISKDEYMTNFADYPTRWCVIDYEKMIAIDIKMNLKYIFVEHTSNLNFLSVISNLKKDKIRAAILPHRTFSIPDDIKKKSEIIIDKLLNNYEFVDGNDLYNNEEYLQMIEKENNKKIKKDCSKVKTKRKNR